MYIVKLISILFFSLSFTVNAQECSKILDAQQVPELATLERCRDFTQRQARRFERPVFKIELEQDLLERLIYVISEKETCFSARESFFSSYGIRNREIPKKDMGDELKRFWDMLKKACPNI
jgi:AAA15 family ATPase/GTPase